VTPKANTYFVALDKALREAVNQHLTDEEGFGVMVRYALGWETADGQPYNIPTGKRLRPLVMLLCANALTSDWQKALPAAVAVELLHNFSLIHDDIQDDSPVRHGRPTVWKVWGIANAINAGDALFTLSYAALSDLTSHIEASLLVQVWRTFNATNVELTRGQHLDMRFERQTSVTVDEYISMIKGKSAALISTSAYFGALLACEDQERAKHFADFGLNLGIAFQIHDDILGIWGESSVTGKSTATDIISRKKSLPVLHGLHHSSTLRDLYAKPTFEDADLPLILEELNRTGSQEYTRQQEEHYYNIALESLELGKPDPALRPDLDQFVAFLFQRNY
jgi:geranylgeranyl diphosphate synthase type I